MRLLIIGLCCLFLSTGCVSEQDWVTIRDQINTTEAKLEQLEVERNVATNAVADLRREIRESEFLTEEEAAAKLTILDEKEKLVIDIDNKIASASGTLRSILAAVGSAETQAEGIAAGVEESVRKIAPLLPSPIGEVAGLLGLIGIGITRVFTKSQTIKRMATNIESARKREKEESDSIVLDKTLLGLLNADDNFNKSIHKATTSPHRNKP